MIAAAKDHARGLEIAFKQLISGKYLVYFIPGTVILLIFLPWFLASYALSGGAGFFRNIPLIGDFFSGAVSRTLSFFDIMIYGVLKFTVITLLSPFNGRLSERLDNDLTGNKFDGGIARFLRDMGRAVLIVTIALTTEFLFFICWWLLSWMLGLGFLDNLVYFTIGAFFFGLSFYDYSFERYGLSNGASWIIAVNKASYMFFTGAVFQLILAVPFAGIVVAPVFTTMLATVIYIKLRNPEGRFPTEHIHA